MSLADKLARLREPEPAPAAKEWADDLIPDVGPSTYVRTEDDDQIDTLLGGIDIEDAYNRWCGKMVPDAKGKRESIMVSCPDPSHPDGNPSAWLNADKGTYFCGGCQAGGDSYDIAAYHFGYDVPGYKTNGSFPELRRKMAESMGYVVRKTPGGQEYAEPIVDHADPGVTVINTPDPDPEPEPESDPAAEAEADLQLDIDVAARDIRIDWKKLLPRDTFMRQWMDTVSVDDLPEEYYFWLGLQMVGLAAGDDAVLDERHLVKPNLYLVLFGPSGIGKSKSLRSASELLRKALPYDIDDPGTKGVLMVPTPGSAESLVDMFSKPELDTATNIPTGKYLPVRGLVRFDEFASFTERAGRAGSILKPTLMEFYDSYQPIELRSRTAGYVRADGHFCSAVTTTQPKVIRDLVGKGDADSGFLNRWVFVAGRTKPLDPFGGPRVDLEPLVDPLRDLRAWASSGRNIEMDHRARVIYTEFFREHIEPHRISDEHPLLTRIDLVLKKVALLLAIDAKSNVIDEPLMERTIELHEYLYKTYGLLDANLNTGGPLEECQTEIKKLVAASGATGMSMRDIERKLNKRFPRDIALKGVKTLVEFKVLEETLEKPARGPSKAVFRYAR